MLLFDKKRKVDCSMEQVKARMVRLKKGNGGEGAQKKVIELTLAVPLTKKLRELLDNRLASLLHLAESEVEEVEIPINSVDFGKDEKEVTVNLYSANNHTPGATPVWTRDSDSPAKMLLQKIVVKDDGAQMILRCTASFGFDIWKWAGDCIGGGNAVLEFKPFQSDLPELEAAAAAAEAEKKSTNVTDIGAGKRAKGKE